MSDLWLDEFERTIEEMDEDNLGPTRAKLRSLGLDRDEIEETLSMYKVEPANV